MSFISDIFIQKQSALIRLQALSDAMPDISKTFDTFKSLSDQGILSKTITDQLTSDYKSQLLTYANNEVNLANQEGTMIATASSNEVLDKVKAITPIIAGTPVITVPDPITAGVEESAFLAQVPTLATNLTNLLNNFNTVLG